MTEAQNLMASLFPERSAKPAPVAGGGLSALLVDLHITALPLPTIRAKFKAGHYAPAKPAKVAELVRFARGGEP